MSKQQIPVNIGVINPYALAEVVLGRKISWKRITNPGKFLEKTLQVPYDKLFDPRHESPLYVGLRLDSNSNTMERAEILPSNQVSFKALSSIAAATAWIDPGDFFEECTELTDPVQGALGDCYFIAALSSVAWARPYVIAQRTRAGGTSQQQFVDTIQFFSGGKSEMVDVSELLPLQSPGNAFIYARSAETGEIWPAVYEKAYAKWRTKDAGDKPNYAPIAGGDPVAALSQLTGLSPFYIWNSSLSAHDIWQKIRGNCISYKTFNPMVAWTHATSPNPNVNYNNAHLAANHAYSILGWAFINNQEFVVLRNPWGTYEATLNVTNMTWTAWDQPYYSSGRGYWRPIPMANNDGIFALRADTFKDYFAGFGWVKTPESP